MHSNLLYDKILPNGRQTVLKDYELNYQSCNFGVGDHSKCCVGGHFERFVSFFPWVIVNALVL